MAIDVLVFDLGKVIFDFDLEKLAVGFHRSSKKSKKEIFTLLSDHIDLFADYEKGLIGSESFYKQVSELMNMETDYQTFCGIWNDIFTPVKGMDSLIKRLSASNNLAILSNTNDLHFEYLQNKYPDFFSYFTNLHLSYKMGSRKPDKEIYEHVIDFYGIDPARIFFTDDLEHNIIPAREMGINAYRFDGPEMLKKNLNSLGVNF